MTESKTPVVFTPERLQRAEEYLTHYPADRKKSALLPLLHLLQEQEGWVSVTGMDYVAGLLGITPIEVYEVATFYTMYHVDPVGRHVIEYCRTGPCMLMGGEEVYAHLKQAVGAQDGETSADGLFTVKPVECLAACGWGPCFQIREKYYTHLTIEKVDALVDELRAASR